MKQLRVLVGCEFSGITRDAFTRAGHIAMSCDFLPSETPGWHYQGNVLDVLDFGWDLAIFHPDCTYFTLAGARWFGDPRYPDRYEKREEAIDFFRKLQNCDIPRVCIENPQPLMYVMNAVGRYTQKIQPWMFGEPETKGLCLWLKGLPPLSQTEIMSERNPRVWKMGPGPNRKKERSRSYEGVARAMVQQWGMSAS